MELDSESHGLMKYEIPSDNKNLKHICFTKEKSLFCAQACQQWAQHGPMWLLRVGEGDVCGSAAEAHPPIQGICLTNSRLYS